jgi:hypothetical protein
MKYFVSFNWMEEEGTSIGSGDTVVDMNTPICTWEDVEEIKRQVTAQHDRIKKVIILNWKRMELPE